MRTIEDLVALQGPNCSGVIENRHPPLSPPSPTPPHIPLPCSSRYHLRAASPFGLAPVGRTAEIRAGATEVGSGAAEASRTLGIDDRAAGIARIGNLGGSGGSGGDR